MNWMRPSILVPALALVIGALVLVFLPQPVGEESLHDSGQTQVAGSKEADLGAKADQAIEGGTDRKRTSQQDGAERVERENEPRRWIKVVRPDGSILTSGKVRFVELERGRRNELFVRSIADPSLIDFGPHIASATEYEIPANGIVQLPAGGVAIVTAREGNLVGNLALDLDEMAETDVSVLQLVDETFCDVRVLRADGSPASGVVVELQRCDLKELARSEQSGRPSRFIWNRMFVAEPTDQHGRTAIQSSFPTAMLQRRQLLDENSRVRAVCSLGYENDLAIEFSLGSREEIVFRLPPAGHVEIVLVGYPSDAAPVLEVPNTTPIRPELPGTHLAEGQIYRFENVPLSPQITVQVGRWTDPMPSQRSTVGRTANDPHRIAGPQQDNATVRSVLSPSIQGCFHGRLVESSGRPFVKAPERSWQTAMIARLKDQSTLELAFEPLADGHFLARWAGARGRNSASFGDVAELFMLQVPNMPGYSAPQQPLHGSWARIPVDAKDDDVSVDLGEILMGQESPVFAWQIVDRSGRPIEGARVSVFERDGTNWDKQAMWTRRLYRGPFVSGPDGTVLAVGFGLDDALQRRKAAEDVYRIEISHEDFVRTVQVVQGLPQQEQFVLEGALRIQGSMEVPPWVREVRAFVTEPSLNGQPSRQVQTNVWAAQDLDPDGGKTVTRKFELGPLAAEPVDLVIELAAWSSPPLVTLPGVIPGDASDQRLHGIDLVSLTDLFEIEVLDLEGKAIEEDAFQKGGLAFRPGVESVAQFDVMRPKWQGERAQLVMPAGIEPQIWLTGAGFRSVDLSGFVPGRHTVQLERQPVVRGRIQGKDRLPSGWAVSVKVERGRFGREVVSADDSSHDFAFVPQLPEVYRLRWLCTREGQERGASWSESLELSAQDLLGIEAVKLEVPQELIDRVLALEEMG